MTYSYGNRQTRTALREAVEEAIRDRTNAQTAKAARTRLTRPGELDYVGAAIRRDIPQYPAHADAIADAYLDLVDDHD